VGVGGGVTGVAAVVVSAVSTMPVVSTDRVGAISARAASSATTRLHDVPINAVATIAAIKPVRFKKKVFIKRAIRIL
jgi:hypothetical protein